MAGGFNGTPKENQDGFLIYQAQPDESPPFVTAVLDGHGINGRLVSALAEKELGQQFLDRCHQGEPIGPALEGAILDTATIVDQSTVDCREAGSTVVACTQDKDELIVANVGDSRCVLGRCQGGKWSALPLSRDHKPDDAIEKRRIQGMGGFVEPTRVRGWGYQGPPRVWKRKQQVHPT
jgi:serine/threonine protein phosphatase PrpC